MILSFIIVGVMVANSLFNWINSWLPKYVPEQNFWLVDILYRVLKCVGAACLLYPLTILTWHWPTIIASALLFLLAFVIKRVTWHLAYKDYL